ncbi:M43 family zinc metalloprotease [Flavobacterium urocaniciphilum]|uniref:Por secretion system C-terminal sorting domain-containing protein n=1 Tax=Flavobacterium urocaniciphilum TaxID=1299341 RepID=A0A1H9AGP8_9FLAO|nr:M43 family zinc metalloprotease [Flavobacterium urocaniciphilum]SEP75829.1 Por secretion system C-terminal sorting domain-containing protein [Flavobacterium urocaniciphilum]
MKKITLILSLLVCFTSVIFAQNKSGGKTVFGRQVNPENITPSGHIRCASNEYEEYLRSQDSKMETREQFENWLAQKIKEQKDLQEVSSQSGGIIYIPVVVHVIHNGDAYGTGENITDEQVQSQMTVMTQDFRKMAGTPGENFSAVGADTQIEFVLAKVDPNGNPTNGIDRVNMCKASWSTGDINSIVKPATIWDPTLYMNMWSVNFTDTSLLGYAQFPSSSGLTGLNANGGAANTDGVVAGYGFFGSSDLATGNFAAPFDKGRTMTHEVGHFLGLRHIWGDANCGTDYCADTPTHQTANGGCPTHPKANSCGTSDEMFENYMDYTDDACMNIFTNDQKTRITTVMNNSPRRASLKTSTKDVAIPLFANDAEVIIQNSCTNDPTCAVPNPPSPAKTVYLYNRGTSNLTSATISYNINGGTTYNQNWTGNLATNQYAVVTLTNSASYGTLNVSITAANGTDQRASNNTASKTFGITNPLAYANTTSFTFNLVTDRYASEVSWKLRNQAGTILYSGGTGGTGGAYTNGTTNTLQYVVTNQSWTLPASGCYYLTVTDSYGDGLYDGINVGYYTVTGASTNVVNVTDFVASNPANTPASRVSYFTNNIALDSDSYSLISDVKLYPNPSRDFFTIDVPQGIERTGKMEIFNSIGQKVVVKNISSDADLTVDVASFANGVYFLNLNLGDATKTLKFIKE